MFADGTNLVGGRRGEDGSIHFGAGAAIHRDPDRLDEWAEKNLMKFSRAEGRSPARGRTSLNNHTESGQPAKGAALLKGPGAWQAVS